MKYNNLPVITSDLLIEPPLYPKSVTISDVEKAIIELKSSRAKDVYGMDTLMLKQIGQSIKGPLTHIINVSLDQGKFPESWKIASVIPIFKGGNSLLTSNYRPISILPTVSKVFEKLVAKQIINHLNCSSFPLHSMQFGFRAYHSTETATCYFLEKVKSNIDKGGIVGGIFLDLRKAFDTVNHSVLLHKLHAFNFSSKFISLINSYLLSRSQSVRIDQYNSTPLLLSTGVPQGSILGPILFSLYINELPSLCKNCDTLMYADDTVILAYGKSAEEVASKLTEAVSWISIWLEQSCLQLNISKTVTMFFSKNNINIEPEIFISGERLQVVTEYKYLGLYIDSNLNFKTHIKKVSNRIKFSLANFRFIRDFMSTEAAKLYFFSMILSHITYCLISWSNTHSTTIKPLERLYKQALKILDKKPYHYHHCSILRKYQLLTWDNLIKFKNICLIYKIRYGLAPPPLCDFIHFRSSEVRVTRGAVREDCIIPRRKTAFGQAVFSVRAVQQWNTVPATIRESLSFFSFKKNAKKWLVESQTCGH